MQVDTASSYNLIFDVFEVLAGIYVVYNAISMKRSGRLLSNGLIGKKVNLAKAPDIPGYIRTMFPVYMISGSLFILLGFVSAWLDLTGGAGDTVSMAITGILIAVCAYFAVMSRKGQDRYLMP